MASDQVKNRIKGEVYLSDVERFLIAAKFFEAKKENEKVP